MEGQRRKKEWEEQVRGRIGREEEKEGRVKEGRRGRVESERGRKREGLRSVPKTLLHRKHLHEGKLLT